MEAVFGKSYVNREWISKWKYFRSPRQLEKAILESDILKALHKLNDHKSASKNGIVSEMITTSGWNRC